MLLTAPKKKQGDLTEVIDRKGPMETGMMGKVFQAEGTANVRAGMN